MARKNQGSDEWRSDVDKFIEATNASLKQLVEALNSIDSMYVASIQRLWENQDTLDWKLSKILYAIDSSQFKDPGPYVPRPMIKEGG